MEFHGDLLGALQRHTSAAAAAYGNLADTVAAELELEAHDAEHGLPHPLEESEIDDE